MIIGPHAKMNLYVLINKSNYIVNISLQAQGDGPVSWLAAGTDTVEEMRSKLTAWAVSEMDVSSLSIFPTEMKVGNSRGTQELLHEFSQRFVRETLELDPDVTVEVQSKSCRHKMIAIFFT